MHGCGEFPLHPHPEFRIENIEFAGNDRRRLLLLDMVMTAPRRKGAALAPPVAIPVYSRYEDF